jgi:hypothetical protein
MKYIVQILLSLLPLSAGAQGVTQSGVICRTPLAVENHTIPGDPARALRSYNPAYEDTVVKLVVKLGYLYKDSATIQEFYDHFQVGLRVLRFNKYKVVKYAISYLPRGADYIHGNSVPVAIPMAKTYLDMIRFQSLKPGDKIFFDIEVQKDSANYTLKMPTVEIKIIPDSNR